jgi:hypothetical protein
MRDLSIRPGAGVSALAYARFFTAPRYPNDIRPRFDAVVDAQRESYDLAE